MPYWLGTTPSYIFKALKLHRNPFGALIHLFLATVLVARTWERPATAHHYIYRRAEPFQSGAGIAVHLKVVAMIAELRAVRRVRAPTMTRDQGAQDCLRGNQGEASFQKRRREIHSICSLLLNIYLFMYNIYC